MSDNPKIEGDEAAQLWKTYARNQKVSPIPKILVGAAFLVAAGIVIAGLWIVFLK